MNAMLPQSLAAVTTDAGLISVFAAVTAIVGLVVASLAYWGHRRNESRPMLFLALGILLLTTVPVGVDSGLTVLTTATDAEILLAVTISHLVGVSAILYALTGA